mmetsp:Transcript_19366/g.41985  ORF Transcript_19366/g.41985 Transcript_19366/m.41985 type:complete len:132 (+) Transcript_19366:15-410(+)
MSGTVGAVALFFGSLDALWLSLPILDHLSFRVACGTVATVMSMASTMADSELFVDGIQIPCFLGVLAVSITTLYRGYPMLASGYCLVGALCALSRDLLRAFRNRQKRELGRRVLLGVAILCFHSAAVAHRF